MKRRDIVTWAIIIIIAPFILFPHAIAEWLPAEFFYGRKVTERHYSYGKQTIRFDEYREYYVLSYIESGKVRESLRWRYHNMNAPFMGLVFFSDSLVVVATSELTDKIVSYDKKTRLINHIESDSTWRWLDDANFAMAHYDYLTQNWLEVWPDSIYRRCCRIESWNNLDKETQINTLIDSKVQRRITKNRTKRRKKSNQI